MATIIGLCTIELHLPGVDSLKGKRSIVKSLLTRLSKEFNVSAAEVEDHDVWQSAVIAIAAVSNASAHNAQVFERLLSWIETHYSEALIVSHDIEML